MNFKGFGQARNAAFRRRGMPATAFSVALAVIGAGIFLHPGTDTAEVATSTSMAGTVDHVSP